MGTRATTLVARYKTADGSWKRAEAVRGANGRIRPGYVLENGRPMQVRDYLYQVRYYEQRKLKYQTVGRDAAEAETLRRRIEQRTTVKAAAKQAGMKIQEERGPRTLAESAAEYIRDAEQRNATEAALQARSVTAEFLQVTRKTYVDEVDREDFFRFHRALSKRGCSGRTVANKDARLRSWLTFAGIPKRDSRLPEAQQVMPRRPRYEEKLPTIYTSDEISTILGAADGYMSLAIGLALKCGLREQELIHLEWTDIDEKAGVLRIRGKTKYGFQVKDSEQRDVPIPADLLAELKAWRAAHKRMALILGTPSRFHGLPDKAYLDRPNKKLLRALKQLAKREKLNCGHCDGCKGPNQECREWNLHKFRRTYCTTLLRSSMDLRTVQALMGHSDLASTMRYLRPAGSAEVRERINQIKW